MISAQKDSKHYLLPILCIVLGFFFVLLENLNVLGFARNGLSFVLEPMTYGSTQAGSEVSSYLNTFVNFSDFKKDYNDIKYLLAETEVENAKYSLLLGENASLKEQLAIKDDVGDLLLAQTLADDGIDFLKINKGSIDGVNIGDVAMVGDMYVGLVVQADLRGSLVRLPTSSDSHLAAVVVKSDGFVDGVLNQNILSRAVISGAPEGIKIENIPMNANVKDGDIVLVNDEKVGEYLVVGYLVSLSENPASTSREGYVSPILDYDDIITLFVKLKSTENGN